MRFALLFALTLVACRSTTDVADSRAWCAADPARFQTRSSIQNIDDEFAYYAAHVPGGFGGFYIANGRKEFHLKDMTQASAAAAALNSLLVGGGPGPLHAVPGDFDWLELYGCYRVPQFPSGTIVSSDIDELRNRIVFGVPHDSLMPRAEAALQAASVPRAMFILERQSPVPLGAGND